MPALVEPDPLDTPIFILNFNQVSFLARQVAWLLQAGYRNLTVIDNHSTYPPLLSYYDELTRNGAIALRRRAGNDDKRTVWDEHLRPLDRPFVFTSSDVVPDASCPADVVARLGVHLREHPEVVKVGLGLRIDDLPPTYRHRREVRVWEGEFWRAPVAPGLFSAPVDSTFALYRRGTEYALWPALRTGWPYLARHEPWYADSAHPSEEALYYAATIAPHRGTWGRERLPERIRASCEALAAAPPRTLVHLACGHDVFAGWVNVDARADVGADVVFDPERCAHERLPIDADSVDGFYMGHAFARVEATLALLQELYRVARPDARFVLRVSGVASDSPWRGRGLESFDELAQPAREGRSDAYTADWRLARVRLVVDPSLAGAANDTQVLARMGGPEDVVRELIVELRAVKPPRPRDRRLHVRPIPTVTDSPIDPDSQF